MSGTRRAETAFTLASSFFHRIRVWNPATASGFRTANRDPGTGGKYLRKEPISIEVVCRERYLHLDQLTAAEEALMDQTKTDGPPKADSLRESVTGSISRGNEAVSAAASDEIDTAGADFKALQSDLSKLKETVAKLASRASDEAAKSARQIAGQVSAAAGDLAGKRDANVADVATDQAKTLVTELENIARRNPLGALAGAVVVGVLIGMMGRRS
jgi:ElaB/YqjD/DUF883 family membrane-anchored ribosome-binding protein